MVTGGGQASQAAQLIADLVRDSALFPEDAAKDLKRLLGNMLADPPLGSRRWDNLWLLVQVIIERDGLLPTVGDYESARTGEEGDAPVGSTLVKRYGHWMSALRAATRLISLDTSKPARAERHRYRAAYRPAESAIAIARFYRTFNSWPTYPEYTDWARVSKQAARACGAPDPRLPAGSTIARHYGTFDRALQAAKTMYRGAQ
jgi:hypothetical protein